MRGQKKYRKKGGREEEGRGGERKRPGDRNMREREISRMILDFGLSHWKMELLFTEMEN